MATVDVVPDAACNAVLPHQFPAIVRATLRDGSVWTQEVLTNRGGPQRPLSDAELARKFADNVAGRLDDDAAAAVQTMALDLEALPEIGRLLAPLTTF